MSDKLEPCPFCGSNDLGVKTTISVYTVRCDGCGAQGPLVVQHQEAIRLWTTRKQTEPT